MRGDMFGIPQPTGIVEQSFRVAGQWHVWQKPRNATFVYFYLIGGGGAGGGGASRTAGVNGRGGGGGSDAVQVAVMAPGILVPDRLYFYVGRGGVGGNADTAGGAAEMTRIAIAPNTSDADLYMFAEAGNFGGGGGLVSAGAGGAAVATALSGVLSPHNFYGAIGIHNGRIGGAGAGATGAGGQGGVSANSLCSSGGGGGCVTTGNIGTAGGPITGSSWVPTILGGTSSGNGNNGHEITNPSLFFLAGSGGGGNPSSTGGRGGNGACGSGGGGGGAGTPTGGAGGNGGDGMILVLAW